MTAPKHRYGIGFSGALACASLLATGCVMEVGEIEGDSTVDALGAELVGGPGEAPYFQETWTQANGPTRDVADYDKYWCALSGVTGSFRGLGEEVRLKHATGNPAQWRLTVKSGLPQGNVGATVTCYHRELFKLGEGLNLVSGEWMATQTSPEECDDLIGCPTEARHDPIPTLAKAWNGDAVTMITGLTGNFGGFGEYVTVDQAQHGDEQTEIGAQTAKTDGQTARVYAHSYYAGKKNRKAITEGDYKLTSITGTKKRKLSKASTHMCYLTHVGGRLSKHTSITIKENGSTGFWELEVKSTGSERVSAAARCVALDQS